MNKKSLPIILTASILAILIASIGAFSASAYVPDATEDTIKIPESTGFTEIAICTFPTRPAETIEPTTEPTAAADISKGLLYSELNKAVNAYLDVTGFIFENIGTLHDAYQKGLDIYNDPNAAQEQINEIYYELIAAQANIHIIGWTAAPYLKGDMNNDQQVNILDATEIQLALASANVLDDVQSNRADVNNDMHINIMDVTYIQLYCAGDESPENKAGTYSIEYYYYNQ